MPENIEIHVDLNAAQQAWLYAEMARQYAESIGGPIPQNISDLVNDLNFISNLVK